MGELNTHNPILWFFVVCFVGSIIVLGWLLKPFFPILVLGAVVSGFSYPLFCAIKKQPKIGPPMAAFVTCLVIFVILFVPIVFFVGSLTQQAFGLYQMAKGAVLNEQINALLRDSQILERINSILANFNYTLTGEEIKKVVSEIGKFVGLFLYEQARAVASNTLTFVANFFLILLVIFFLLLDGERLVSYIIDLSPLPADQEQKLIGKFKEMAHAILIGNGLGGLIQGGLGGLQCFRNQNSRDGTAGVYPHCRYWCSVYSNGNLPVCQRPHRRCHLFCRFLPGSVRRHRIFFQAKDRWQTGGNSSTVNFFCNYRRPQALWYFRYHIWSSGGNRFFDHGRYLPRQLQTFCGV